MKKLSLLISLFVPFILKAQNFSLLPIPDSLKKNANVVTRYEEKIYEIKSPGKAIEHERHVYTILNESADYLGKYRTYYGDFDEIKYVLGTLYDATGKQLKRFKLRDMQDFSVTDGFSLMLNERVKTYDFYNRSYPYTVDFEEDDEINGILNIDSWVPQGINRAAVEHTKIVVITPVDYVLRYKAFNCSIQPVITEENGKKIYTWEMKNLTAKKPEVLSPDFEDFMPYVMIGPSKFEAQGYKGDMSTWEGYGKFINQLRNGRDVLPENIKKQAHQLTDKVSDPRQKIAILYDFLQKNTHYISIQLGIGGWQPFDANYVATKKYGDCKALSNYMVALLKEVGIEAKYVTIDAGKNASKLIEEFPCFQFNHVTCFVPVGKDSIWLECTSQTTPPGYAGSFTGNRKAIMIDENGGHIVNTPVYTAVENLQSRKIQAELTAEGNLSANVITQYRAERQDELSMEINDLSKEKVLENLKSGIDLPTYDIVKYEYNEDKKSIPSVFETLVLTVPDYAQVTGKRLFINPNLMTHSSDKLSVDESRKYDIAIKDSYTEIDSVEIKIPLGYELEAIPQDVNLDSKFGRYYSNIRVMPDKILYFRTRVQNENKYPASDYPELVKFYESIYKADHSRVVLVKKE